MDRGFLFVAGLALAACWPDTSEGAASTNPPPDAATGETEPEAAVIKTQSDAARTWPKLKGHVRLNYGVQQDSEASFAGSTRRDITYANRLLQGVFRVAYRDYELDFDGYLRQSDSGDWDSSARNTTLNSLFATVPLGQAFKLKVGRQRALWGHGFAYVPTDFINPPLDPAGLDLANARGVDSVTLDIYRKQNTLTLLYNFDKSANREGFGVKLTSSALRNIDWNLVYYHAPRPGHAGGMTFSTDPLAWLFPDSDGTLQVFANLALRERSHYFDPFDPATGLLQTPTSVRDHAPFFTCLMGVSHEVPQWRVSSRIEYYFIEDAYRRHELNGILNGLRNDLPTFHPWIDRLAYGRSQRHYVSLAVGQSTLSQASDSRIFNTLGYGVGALHGLNDGSTLFSFNLTSGYFDRAEIELNTLLPVGSGRSEFGTMPFRWRVDLSLKFTF